MPDPSPQTTSLLPALLHDLVITRELLLAGRFDASTKHIETAIGRISEALLPAASSVLPVDNEIALLQAEEPSTKDCSERMPA